MGGRTRTTGGDDEPDAPKGHVSVPWVIIAPILAAVTSALLTGGTLRYTGDDTDVQKLRVEIVELRADVRAVSSLLIEVKAIEEAAHPRVGVPPSLFHGVAPSLPDGGSP